MLLLVSIVGLHHLMEVSAAPTATVSVSPATGMVTIGQPVVVNVLLNTGNQPVAGVDITMSYSASLQFVSADATGSVFDQEIAPPAPDRNEFHFSRVSFGTGYNGSNGQLIKLTFMTKTVGPASITIKSTSDVLAYDDAANIFQTANNASFTIKEVDGPDIDVQRNGSSLLTNATINFGSQIINTDVDQDFVIENKGNEPLTLTTQASPPTGFTIQKNYDATIAPGAKSTFTIRTRSEAPGTNTWPITLVSNDADENPFRITVGYTSTNVPEPDLEITDGVSIVHTVTGSFMMITDVGKNTQKPIRISNIGTATLTLERLVSAPQPFSIITAPLLSIPPGRSTTMLVRFSPSTPGTFTWPLTLNTNVKKKEKILLLINGTTTGKAAPVAVLPPAAASSVPNVPTSAASVATTTPLPSEITVDLCATMQMVDNYNPIAGALAAFLDGANVTFGDVPGDSWYARYLRPLMVSGIIRGYANADGTPRGVYGGGDGLRYDQIAKILALSTKQSFGPLQGQKPANATAVGQWSEVYVLSMERLGVPLFSPNLNVGNFASRAEAVSAIVSAFRVPSNERPVPFSDVPATHPYASSIRDATNYGIVSGNPDGTFRPDQPLNRAEMAKMTVIAIRRACIQ